MRMYDVDYIHSSVELLSVDSIINSGKDIVGYILSVEWNANCMFWNYHWTHWQLDYKLGPIFNCSLVHANEYVNRSCVSFRLRSR